MNPLSPDQLNTLELSTPEEVTATATDGGDVPAAALCDLLDNGERAAPGSVHRVLAFIQQIDPSYDLLARLQRAAAELDRAVQRANLIQPHVLDHHALFLAPKTVERVTGHLLDGAGWQALMRGRGAVGAQRRSCRVALLRHAGVLEAAAPRTRESLALAGQAFSAAVSHGPGGSYAMPEATVTERDLAHRTVADLDLRLALVLLGEEVPMTHDRLLEWYRTHRPGVLDSACQVTQALEGMGEDFVAGCERVVSLLRETLRASGAALLSLDIPMGPEPRSAASTLALQLVVQALLDEAFQAKLKAGGVNAGV